MDAEAGGATGLLSGTNALGDVARNCVVAGGETCGGDGCGGFAAGDLAAGGGPGVGGLFLQVEVAGGRSDGDGVAGEDIRGLDGTAELNGWRWCDLAEAENDARG